MKSLFILLTMVLLIGCGKDNPTAPRPEIPTIDTLTFVLVTTIDGNFTDSTNVLLSDLIFTGQFSGNPAFVSGRNTTMYLLPDTTEVYVHEILPGVEVLTNSYRTRILCTCVVESNSLRRQTVTVEREKNAE